MNRLLDQSSVELEKLQSHAKSSHKRIVEAENLIESLERNLRVAESLLREKDEQLNELSEALVISKVEYKALLEKFEDEGSPNQPRRISLFLEGQKPLQNVTVGTQDTSTFLAGMEIETLGVVTLLDGAQLAANKFITRDEGSDDSRLRESNCLPGQVIISQYHKFELKVSKLKMDKAIETLDLGLKKLRRNSSPGQNIDLGQVIQYIEMSKDVSEQAGTGLKKKEILSDAAKRVMRKLGSNISNDQSSDSISSVQDNEIKENEPPVDKVKATQNPSNQPKEGKSQLFSGISLKIPGLKRADSEEWTELQPSTMVGHSSSTTVLPEISPQLSETSRAARFKPETSVWAVMGVQRYPTFSAADKPDLVHKSAPSGEVEERQTTNTMSQAHSDYSDRGMQRISTKMPDKTQTVEQQRLKFTKQFKPQTAAAAVGSKTAEASGLLGASVSRQSKVSPNHKQSPEAFGLRSAREDFHVEPTRVHQVMVGTGVENLPEWQRVTAKFGPQNSTRTSPRLNRMESIPVGEAEVAAFSRALRKFTASSKSRSPPKRVSRTDSRGKLTEIKSGGMSERSKDRIVIPKQQHTPAELSVKSAKIPSPRTKSVTKSQAWSFSVMDHDPNPQDVKSGATTFRSEMTQEDQIESQRASIIANRHKFAINPSSLTTGTSKSRELLPGVNPTKSMFLNVESPNFSKSQKFPTIRPRTSTNSEIRPITTLEARKMSGYNF